MDMRSPSSLRPLSRCGEVIQPSFLFLWIARRGVLPTPMKAVETGGSLAYRSHFVHGVTVMNAAVLGVVIIALLVGALVGWVARSPGAAGARQTVDNLRLQLDAVVKERDANRDAATRLAALEASQLEREKGFEARISELIDAKEALSNQFAEISNKLLAQAQETFLKRADDRFRQSEENSGKNL